MSKISAVRLVDVHVYVVPSDEWIEQRKLAKRDIIDQAISSGFVRRRSPCTVGLVIWQANEPVHHDLSIAVQNLHWGVSYGREFRDEEELRVLLVPHETTQRQRNMYYVKKFGQDLLQED
ncbi:hypothetical protein TNCV_3312351 [Trichonephila clavipes]|nr:hypothetical protein TNCV_3312351 [Trichonephila clavipes]